MELLFKRLEHGIGLPLPAYGTDGAAGMDVCSARSDITLMGHGGRAVIETGFAVEVPPGYELQVRPRSGLAAKNGISVVNSPGTIDSDYRGEIKVILINHGHGGFPIERGDRIAQLVLAPVVHADVVEVDDLGETVRGACGFGSTGV